mmetsp:Transcript_17455/g.42824  ORF Transcript_17455/g.42824 Transcript_17455/m.42824 type:complete len:303 (+) Transcript_17455:56-964(+)
MLGWCRELENRIGKALSFLAGILVTLCGLFLLGEVEELSDISIGNVMSRSCADLYSNQNSRYSLSCPTISSTKVDILPQCFNSSVWTGDWDLNRSLVKPGARMPADEDLARRYHPKFESSCNMTDILRLSANEIISVEEQLHHLEKIDELMSKYEIQAPRYVVLSGIEWDMKWYKDNKQQVDWNYTNLVVDEKVSLLQQHYPDALALFLRTQPYTSGKEGSLASQESFQRYNDLFYAAAHNHNPNKDICGGVHVADLAEMMLYNGTAESGWSDGVHPSGWVSTQFLNILLNVVSLIGEVCRS